MITIRIEKTRGHKWNETGTFALEFPKSELRHRVYDCQLDKDGETEDAWLCIPSERLRAKYERLVDDEESTQSDYDKLYEELWAYSGTLNNEQLMDWFIDLNDPETISGWTERIEAHNAYIDVMEPNNAVLRNPLDVDSTFHIRIYDYFIDFHEDMEMVDDLEFTPSDVEADDWTEDIKRCLEENGWRLDSRSERIPMIPICWCSIASRRDVFRWKSLFCRLRRVFHAGADVFRVFMIVWRFV